MLPQRCGSIAAPTRSTKRGILLPARSLVPAKPAGPARRLSSSYTSGLTDSMGYGIGGPDLAEHEGGSVLAAGSRPDVREVPRTAWIALRRATWLPLPAVLLH
jgi:hypothetical protein